MSWWSDKTTFITPSWEILLRRLANMWSMMYYKSYTVGNFISVKPNVVQIEDN